jgi:hypothetical protein
MAIEKTRLKFAVSEETNELIGFVTRNSTTRKLRGVDEKNNSPKKICVLSEDMKGLIQPGIVYDVDLKPMRTGNGYVVVSAIRPKYKAELETVIIPKSVYQIRITFGHKIIYFDPKDGNSPSSRTIAGVEKALRERKDLAEVEQVIESFEAAAGELLEIIERDGYLIRN